MQASFQVPVGENCVVHPEFPEFKDQCLDFFALIKKNLSKSFSQPPNHWFCPNAIPVSKQNKNRANWKFSRENHKALAIQIGN